MSLTRDRYEQVVRFSWLAQADRPRGDDQVSQLPLHKVGQNIQRTNSQAVAVNSMSRQLGWASSNQRRGEKTTEWESLDLRSMRQKEMGCVRPNPRRSIKKRCGHVCAGLSAIQLVSHCDMYGVNMLGLHKAPSGQLVLAPDPSWPACFVRSTACFDLIQCHEAAKFLGDRSNSFDELLGE